MSHPMSTEEQIQAAQKNLEHLLEWVNRFDNKSLIVLGIDTGMLGVLSSLAPPLRLWVFSTAFLIFFAAITLGASLMLIFVGTYPQTKGPKSLLYFGSIAEHTSSQYTEVFLKQTHEAYLQDLLEQCHRNSEILNRKFQSIQWAYRMLLLAVIPWTVAIYLFRFVQCQ